jgi:hypothetical protein
MHARDADAYREAGDELLKAGARLVLRWRELSSSPPPDPATIAAEVAQRLRELLAAAELLAATPTSGPGTAMEVHTYAYDCASLSADLHRAAVELDPSAVIEVLAEPEDC